MSSLIYRDYDRSVPSGDRLYDSSAFHYSQLVELGDVVKLSGQGGWDEQGVTNPDDIPGQVTIAFKNVERVLSSVGLSWKDVYSVRSYHVGMSASFDTTLALMKSHLPNHKPIWTCIGVAELAFPDMKIEIEVEAYRGNKKNVAATEAAAAAAK